MSVSTNWWDAVSPEFNVEGMTVAQADSLAREGTLVRVMELAGLDISELPEPDAVTVMAKLVLLIVQQQMPERTIDDVMAMPFVAMAKLLGVAAPPANP